MNGYNFTERVRRVLMRAREEALSLRHEYVGTEHMLLAVAVGGGVAEATLVNLGIDREQLRDNILQHVKPGLEAPRGPDLPYTSRAKKTLELSMQEARDMRHSYVGTEHLLIGLLREEKGIAAQILVSMGVTTQAVREEVIRLLGTPEFPPKTFSNERPRTVPLDSEVSITLVVEHPDGRIEAKKFRRSGDAVRFLNGLEY